MNKFLCIFLVKLFFSFSKDFFACIFLFLHMTKKNKPSATKNTEYLVCNGPTCLFSLSYHNVKYLLNRAPIDFNSIHFILLRKTYILNSILIEMTHVRRTHRTHSNSVQKQNSQEKKNTNKYVYIYIYFYFDEYSYKKAKKEKKTCIPKQTIQQNRKKLQFKKINKNN